MVPWLHSVDDDVNMEVRWTLDKLWQHGCEWSCVCNNGILGMFQCSSRFGLLLQDAILYGLAPCQVKFVNHQSNFSEHCTPRRRTIHISLCSLGVGGLYFLLVNVQSFQKFISSFLLFELECLVLFTAMAVVILDIPIHLYGKSFMMYSHQHPYLQWITSPKVILPFGWIYSSKSTIDFWSNWSRPATQLIRHLIYFPLGSVFRNVFTKCIKPFRFGICIDRKKGGSVHASFFGTTLALVAMTK